MFSYQAQGIGYSGQSMICDGGEETMSMIQSPLLAPQSPSRSESAASGRTTAPGAATIKRKRRRSSRGAISTSASTPSAAFAPFRRVVTPDDVVVNLSKPCPPQQQQVDATTTTTQQPFPPQKSHKKTVEFTDNGEEIIERDYCTADQWYNRQDYSDFRVNVRKEVMHLAELVYNDNLCSADFNEQTVVGIEKYCCSEAQQDSTRSSRAQLVRAVLEQQSMQRVIGTKDPEMIAMLSQFHTQESTQRAQERAKAFH